MAEAGQLGAWPHASCHITRASVGFETVGNASCNGSGGNIQLVRLFRNVVFGENGGETAETGGLNCVDACFQECGVHGFNHIGTSETQHLVAALERGAAKVVCNKVEVLNEGAKSTIKNNDSFADGFCVGLATHDPSTLLPPL